MRDTATNFRPPDAALGEYAAYTLRNAGKKDTGWTKRYTSSAGTSFWAAEIGRARRDRDIFPVFEYLQRRQLAKTLGFGATPPLRQIPIYVNEGVDQQTVKSEQY